MTVMLLEILEEKNLQKVPFSLKDMMAKGITGTKQWSNLLAENGQNCLLQTIQNQKNPGSLKTAIRALIWKTFKDGAKWILKLWNKITCKLTLKQQRQTPENLSLKAPFELWIAIDVHRFDLSVLKEQHHKLYFDEKRLPILIWLSWQFKQLRISQRGMQCVGTDFDFR